MEFDLTPKEKIIMGARKKIAVGATVFLSVLWLLYGLYLVLYLDLYDEMKDFAFVTLIIISFEGFFWYPYVRYGRLSLSVAVISAEGIDFVDAEGRCWRSIPYHCITKARRTTVSGTFYGEKKDEVEGTYVCFFLNKLEAIPDVPYHRLFSHKDFSMIYDQEHLSDVLKLYGLDVKTEQE